MRLGLVLVVASLISVPALAGQGRDASAGRALPKVMDAWMVEKTFTAPGGEVQFLANRTGHTIFFRTDGGSLLTLNETRGPRDCDEYLVKEKDGERLPAGCEFVVRDDFDGRTLTVRSEEMREGGLIFKASARAGEKAPYVTL
jgi:hypothetical protein